MWDRTITVWSAGSKSLQTFGWPRHSPFSINVETFDATGWRVGWLIGPKSIIQPTLAATTRIVYCTNSPLQEATAAGLEQANQRQFFESQVKEYAERRTIMCGAFDRLGLKYSLPEGTCFVLLVCIFAMYRRDVAGISRIGHFKGANPSGLSLPGICVRKGQGFPVRSFKASGP